MARIKGLHQDKESEAFESAYKQHLMDNNPMDQMSETDFAEHWIEKQRPRDFGVSN